MPELRTLQMEEPTPFLVVALTISVLAVTALIVNSHKVIAVNPFTPHVMIVPMEPLARVAETTAEPGTTYDTFDTYF